MTQSEFQRELSGNLIRPAYFFLGDEEFLANEGAQMVIAAVLPEQQRSFCLAELGPENQAPEVKRTLLSPSFFGDKRVVRVREFGKMAAEVQEALANAIGHLPSGTHLVIAGQPDKRRTAVKNTLAKVTVVDCPALKQGEAVAWTQSRARRLGLALDAGAARLIVETVGPRLRMIDSELEKALTYLGGENRNLTTKDLGVLLGREREEDVFQLAEVAGSGRAESALQILADLIDLGQPEALLLALMSRHVRQILLAGHLRNAGKRASEAASILGVPPFVVEKLYGQAGKFNHQRCQALLERMHRADVLNKTGERDLRLELELVVLAMAGIG